MKKDRNTFLLIAAISVAVVLIKQKMAEAKPDLKGLPYDRRKYRVNRP